MGGSSSASNSERERDPGLPEDPASSIGQVGAPSHTVIEEPRGHGSEACGDQNPAATENAVDEEREMNDRSFVVKETDEVDESGENGVNRDGKGAEEEQECEKAGQNPASEEGVKDRGKEGNNDKGYDENARNLDVGEHDKDAKSDENGEEDVEKDQEREENGTGNGQQKDCGNESVCCNVEDEWVVTREGKEEVEVAESGTLEYPQRPDAEYCSFYIRTGICKFGLNCKFNHPVRWTNQVIKDDVKEVPNAPVRAECKYYLKTGGCKFGKACKFSHTRGKFGIAEAVEFNFLGLPIRPGERECPYYMRTGLCRYGTNCRFNHPDPTEGGGCDPASGGSVSLGGASESAKLSWSSSKALTENSPFLPMMYSSAPSNYERNGYEASAYTPDRNLHRSRSYKKNSLTTENSLYTHYQQMPVETYPERPGQPECSYFLKTGDCKYRSACRYHHPKNRLPMSTPCAVSNLGLPLRPDQSTCTYYDRYGICKFGPACKFNHPANPSHPASAGLPGPQQLSSPAAAWEDGWE